jgi:hypothetical protein
MATHIKPRAAIAAAQPAPEVIDQDRRKLLTTAAVGIAAAGAASLLRVRPAPAATDETIRPFHINVPGEDLADLRRRLAATRWPEKETVADDSQGVPQQMALMLASPRLSACGRPSILMRRRIGRSKSGRLMQRKPGRAQPPARHDGSVS